MADLCPTCGTALVFRRAVRNYYGYCCPKCGRLYGPFDNTPRPSCRRRCLRCGAIAVKTDIPDILEYETSGDGKCDLRFEVGEALPHHYWAPMDDTIEPDWLPEVKTTCVCGHSWLFHRLAGTHRSNDCKECVGYAPAQRN